MADVWTSEFEAARAVADEVQASLAERNLKHGAGGPEASRITAAARRRLGTLGSALESLRTAVEGPTCAHLTENERNRRRDLVTALRSRREQMLQALKRDPSARSAARAGLLGSSGGAADGLGTAAGPSGRGLGETDATAELSSGGLLAMQQGVMQQQDEELEALERSVVGTKHIALQINEEASLHNRLLDELDEGVEGTSSRLRAAQRRLQIVMRRSGSCKTLLLMFLLAMLLVVVLALLIRH